MKEHLDEDEFKIPNFDQIVRDEAKSPFTRDDFKREFQIRGFQLGDFKTST